MKKQLFEWIEKYDIITIFHHINADGDALGSQFALLTWIKEQYPHKQVFALGDDNSSLQHLFPKHDRVSDEMIQESLAIIVDTSTADRVNDKRAFTAKCKYRIDHHKGTVSFTDYEIVQPQISSTCQLVTMLLMEHIQTPLSKEVSRYLYYGIITDTNSFQTASVDMHTFEIAAYLASRGINITEINRDLYTITRNLYEFRTFLMKQVVFLKNIAYVKITQQDIKRFQISSNDAKECITCLNDIAEISIWGLLVEDEKTNDIYNISLRSYKIVINNLAAKYGGGGHKYAVGIKCLSEVQWEKLLNELSNL